MSEIGLSKNREFSSNTLNEEQKTLTISHINKLFSYKIFASSFNILASIIIPEDDSFKVKVHDLRKVRKCLWHKS